MLDLLEQENDLLEAELSEEATEDFSFDISRFLNAATAIDQYGMNKTTLVVMQSTNLLNGSALEALAVENFTGGPGDCAESQMALESLLDKAKEKIVTWSAKILKFLKTGFVKISDRLTVLWDKIADVGKKLSAAAWDKAKTTGTYVKAHPFKTIAMVVAAAAAVAAIVAMVASRMPGPYANESALSSFLHDTKTMIDRIQWPFGKITTTVVVDGKKTIVCTIDQVKNSALSESTEIATLGWSKIATKSISARLGDVYHSLKKGLYLTGLNAANVLDKGVSAASQGLVKVSTAVVKGANITEKFVHAKTGSAAAGASAGFLILSTWIVLVQYTIIMLVALMMKIVFKAFALIFSTFSNLSEKILKPVTG